MPTLPRTMPFGKHKGLPFSDLPADYLQWLLGLDDLRAPLRAALAQEAERREADARSRRRDTRPALPAIDPLVACELVDAGRRALALRHHPDRGGDLQHMALVNDCADRLRAWLAGAA